MMNSVIDQLKFDENGLITAVIQDYNNNEVLMVAHMNREAVEKTLKGPYVTFWSRSRKKLWVKGEESGHTQEVKEVFIDCDADTLLIKVDQKVATCHEGYRSDFFRKIEKGKIEIIAEKIFEPKEIYKK
ncbi:MAG: phosphoribosyl-AMP cyclohydrolase [Deltaproteobacteria bacterium]|nr:phosphoribosyl-AMP cyclohydrolase [Deltaproteobacteria bacterium]